MQQTKSTLNGKMTSPDSEIEVIRITIEQAKEFVTLRDELMNLTSNRAFKRIFLDGYLKEEASRLVQICAEPNHLDHKEMIQNDMIGISCFRQYMEEVLRKGDQAEQTIIEHEKALDEAYAEDAWEDEDQ